MEPLDKKAEVAKLFSEVSKSLKHSMRKSFEDMGLTLPQSLVIGTLLHFGEMKITELSQRLNLSNSTISGIVDRLEKQQLVARNRSQEDRRIVYVKLTPKFKKVFRGIYKKTEETFAELLNAGTPEEIEQIIAGLNTLKKILDKRS